MMKLSMWIVLEWLREYQPKAQIYEGKQSIHGVRFLADDVELCQEYLYIGYSDQYIDKGKSNVICVNSTDSVFLSAPDIYVVFNEIQKMLEFYNSWETQILQAVNEGKELKELLELSAPVFRTGVAVSDLSLKVLGEARFNGRQEKQQLTDGYLDVKELRLLHSQHQDNLHNHDPYKTVTSVGTDLCCNLFSGKGRITARLISLEGGEGEGVRARMQLMRSFGKLLELWFMIRGDQYSRESLFLDVLEKKETDPGIISVRLEGMGWTGNPGMQLFVFQSASGDPAGQYMAVRFLELNYPELIVLSAKGRQLAVLNEKLINKHAFYEDLLQLLKKHQVYCGVSREFHDLSKLEQNAEQACFAADHSPHEAGSVYDCMDYAPEYIQDTLRRVIDPDMASPALDQLKVYDRENGTDYYHTLYVYLLCERNQTLTAEKLYIHRNSLVYRVGRITSLIGTDLEDERVRVYLLLSYYLRENRPVSGVDTGNK